VLPARDAARGHQLQKELLGLGAAEVTVPRLDLTSLASVSDFLEAFHRDAPPALDGVLLNAGVQSANRLVRTVDGIESTFAVNHLAHYQLLKGLMPCLSAQAVVGWTTSGTHDPKEKAARLFGFRGAQYTTAAKVAAGNYGGASAGQACKDAYATSKLCNIVTARVFAARHPQAASFFSFDPGLMPGTGLAREASAGLQWVWKRVLPRLAILLPGASSTERSSAILTGLLTGQVRGSYNGAFFNFTGKELEPADAAKAQWLADDLIATSDEMLVAYRRQVPLK
jgi:NAD(P)-dependent dehydrogenase (short-subunit alcohol dehydrogenase family)